MEQEHQAELMISNMRRTVSIAKLTEALCKAALEFGEVRKDTDNPFYKSTYADLAELIKATRPALAKNGIAVMQWPLVVDSRAGATTLISHASGEWMESDLTLPVSKMDAQGTGSAITYSRRYAYQSILNVAGEEDDDGNAAVGKTKKQVMDKIADAEEAFDQRQAGEQTLAPFQMKGLEELCKTHGRTDAQVQAFIKAKFNVARIEKVLRRDFDTLKDFILGKIPMQEELETSVKSKTLFDVKQSHPTQADWKRLYAKAGAKGVPQDDVKRWYTETFSVESGNELTTAQFNEVLEFVETA